MNNSLRNTLCDKDNFFRIEDLSDQEFAELDVSTFILANLRRYIGLVVSGTGQLSEAEQADLAGTFLDRGVAPLLKTKQDVLHCSPSTRAKAMLGQLKSIARTRIVEAIWKRRIGIEMPYEVSEGEVAVFVHKAAVKKGRAPHGGYFHILDTVQDTLSADPSENLMFAAEELMMNKNSQCEPLDFSINAERLEKIRSILHPGQYETLKICVDSGFGLKAQDVADISGCSVRKVYARIKSFRTKIFALLPPDLQKDPELIAALNGKSYP